MVGICDLLRWQSEFTCANSGMSLLTCCENLEVQNGCSNGV